MRAETPKSRNHWSSVSMNFLLMFFPTLQTNEIVHLLNDMWMFRCFQLFNRLPLVFRWWSKSTRHRYIFGRYKYCALYATINKKIIELAILTETLGWKVSLRHLHIWTISTWAAHTHSTSSGSSWEFLFSSSSPRKHTGVPLLSPQCPSQSHNTNSGGHIGPQLPTRLLSSVFI